MSTGKKKTDLNSSLAKKYAFNASSFDYFLKIGCSSFQIYSGKKTQDLESKHYGNLPKKYIASSNNHSIVCLS